jgi:hypothetical protein
MSGAAEEEDNKPEEEFNVQVCSPLPPSDIFVSIGRDAPSVIGVSVVDTVI